jgi:hypothetical protein
MSERKARIDLTNLPLRPRQLKPEELQNVFGGCGGYLAQCYNDSDCCLLSYGSAGGCRWNTGFGTQTGRCWPN